MKIAVLSSVAWRTPPEKYGPWEQVASNIAENLVMRGIDVTLYATGNSQTQAKLESAVSEGYEEDKRVDAKVAEYLHISHLMENAQHYDLIHNHFDFMPLSYCRLINTPILTTIHGFSSPNILPMYKKYDQETYYVSISDSDRSDDLSYEATVYNGIRPEDFRFEPEPGEYLLCFSRIHPDKGIYDAIQIAKRSNRKLIIAGLVQDQEYFSQKIQPEIDMEQIQYVGNVGPEERNRLLGGAYALVHPIHFEEPFGLSVVESMMCGTPVIAYSRGSMPELIQHEKTGFLVDTLEDAVKAVSQIKTIDRGVCRDWAVSQFTVDAMVEGYLKVYRAILAK